jgi:hypothetical protein
MFFKRKGSNNSSKSKYKNKKVEYNGIMFDSTKEKNRYIFLKAQENLGRIHDLQLQVKYELIPAIKEEYVEHLKTKDRVKTRTVQLAITYTCDFQYYKDGVIVTEDVKGSPKLLDPCFLLKAKLFRWQFGYSIKRVFNASEEI